MTNNQVAGLLGLATRARKIACGDTVMKSIQNQSAKLVILTDTCGSNNKKKLIDKCTYYQIPHVVMNEIVLNTAIGEWNRKFVAVLDEGFAQKLHACLKG